MEPAPAKFVSKKERRKAAEAEAKPVVKDLPAKQQVAVPRQPAMQPIIVESKQQGKAVADPQGTLQGARKAAAESM